MASPAPSHWNHTVWWQGKEPFTYIAMRGLDDRRFADGGPLNTRSVLSTTFQVPGAKPAAPAVNKDHRSYADFEGEKKAAPSPVANAWSSRPAPARCLAPSFVHSPGLPCLPALGALQWTTAVAASLHSLLR